MPDNEPLDLASRYPGFGVDPHPVYARLRDQQPVTRVVYHGLPCWLVTGREAAKQLLADPALSLDHRLASETVQAVPWVAPPIFGYARGLLNSDPPDHTRLRRLVSAAFTPRRVEELRPRVRQIADDLIDGFAPAGRADLINDFGVELAAIVIMELLGVAAPDRQQFNANCNLFLTSDPEEMTKIPAAVVWLQDFIADLVDVKRRDPGDDLLSKLVSVRDGGDRLTEDELRTLSFLLLLAGFETVSSLIGNGMLTLLGDPRLLATLRDDPLLVPVAVEEMLRHEGPAAAAKIRFAVKELVIGDAVLQPGDPVVISLSAANRDRGFHEDPDVFDLTRTDPHLAFGYGIHFCLGAPLARMEAQIAFTTLLARCRDLRLACPPSELAWRASPIIRSLNRLPVLFTPTGAA